MNLPRASEGSGPWGCVPSGVLRVLSSLWDPVVSEAGQLHGSTLQLPHGADELAVGHGILYDQDLRATAAKAPGIRPPISLALPASCETHAAS